MGAAAVPLLVAGTAVQMYSQYQQGQASAQVAQNNATIMGYRINDATQQGAYTASRILTEGRRVNSSARAAAGANGIDSTTGSTANMFTTSSINAATDAVAAKANAARAAWGFSNEQQDLLAQAKLNARAGALGALGTGLSGFGNAALAYKSR